MSGHTTIALDKFDSTLRPFLTEVSSSALGGEVLSTSDDFFASKDNLIKPWPSVSMKGQFGPTGALYDGWESRRHNPSFDWVIIRLAAPQTTLSHVDIDTSHFSGNECPISQVFALKLSDEEIAASAPVAVTGETKTKSKSKSKSKPLKLSPNDPRWTEVLPQVTLGPNSRHIFELDSRGKKGVWSAVLVRMIPDGGMARFRAYGSPLAPLPLKALPGADVAPINLLSPLLSARIVACSDANFSPPGNLLLPGRGYDMSDGWETRRSQENRGKYAPGQKLHGRERYEWAVARLAGTGNIEYVEVDTAFHPGNYPCAAQVEAILSDKELPDEDDAWVSIVDKKPLGSHRQHWFDRERSVSPTAVFSHVRLRIFPDGGLKRLRVYGHPLSPSAQLTPPSTITLPALPLTVEAFAPYGQVIQGFSFDSSAPKGTSVTIANQGTAFKFHRMANVSETYEKGALVRGGPYVAVTRSDSRLEVKYGAEVPVTVLERHRHTHQAFIPMGKGVLPGGKALEGGGAYLSVVALNGPDDKPDMSTARAFLGTVAQGVSYNMGVWHHSLLTVDGPLDYCLVESQIGDGSILDCEKHTPETPYAIVQVPPYTAAPPPAPVKAALPHANGHYVKGHANGHANGHSTAFSLSNLIPSLASSVSASLDAPIHPKPLTRDGFAPFGDVLQAFPDPKTRWEGQDIQVSPDGKTTKYARLADITSTYPADSNAVSGISVFRATPKVGLTRGKVFDVRFFERHPYTSQAFVPMGKGEWKGKGEEALKEGGEMLVIVAQNGADDKPDPKTLEAFIMPTSMGISYKAGTWHHPVLILDETVDLACVETQISTGIPEADDRDCELLEWDEDEEPLGRVVVPEL